MNAISGPLVVLRTLPLLSPRYDTHEADLKLIAAGDGQTLLARVFTGGFAHFFPVPDPARYGFYTTTNCTGTIYIFAFPPSLAQFHTAFAPSGEGAYPTLPFQELVIQSAHNGVDCIEGGFETAWVGIRGTTPGGFVPPFHLEP